MKGGIKGIKRARVEHEQSELVIALVKVDAHIYPGQN